METSSAVRTAIAIGASAAAAFAGFGIALAQCAVPAVLQSPTPSLLLKQWSVMFKAGHKLAPLTAVLACANFGYVSYANYKSNNTHWQGFAVAAVGTISVVPFTLAFIEGINRKLNADSDRMAAKGEGELSESQIRQLLGRWATLSVVRSLLALGAAGFGVWTALD